MGPACAGAALVFAGPRAYLFGGVDSIDDALPTANHEVFAWTWAWADGRWSQVQDMGPAPRWRHAMAFDTLESEIVMFGGQSVFAPATPLGLLADTWAHHEVV